MYRLIAQALLINLLLVIIASAQTNDPNLIFADNFEWSVNKPPVNQIQPNDQTEQNNNVAETDNTDTAIPNAVPLARDDVITIDIDTSVQIAVLSNDQDLSDGPIQLTISEPAQHGLVMVNADNTLTYIPDFDYMGTDQFIYQITDSNGDSSLAAVSINIKCHDCISLVWDTHPAPVLGYLIMVIHQRRHQS